jgi:putative oxidoreductase
LNTESTSAGGIGRIIGWLERVPYSLLILPARVAVATVFWNSAQTKFANWDATVELFEDEYKLPLLTPDFAAHLTAGIEVSTAVLLLLGLLSRPVALLLLGMTGYIEVFIYPQAWPTHIQWAAMLLFILFRGPGRISIDYLLKRALKIPEKAAI